MFEPRGESMPHGDLCFQLSCMVCWYVLPSRRPMFLCALTGKSCTDLNQAIVTQFYYSVRSWSQAACSKQSAVFRAKPLKSSKPELNGSKPIITNTLNNIKNMLDLWTNVTNPSRL